LFTYVNSTVFFFLGPGELCYLLPSELSERGAVLLDGLAALEENPAISAVATERTSLEQVFMDLVKRAEGETPSFDGYRNEYAIKINS